MQRTYKHASLLIALLGMTLLNAGAFASAQEIDSDCRAYTAELGAVGGCGGNVAVSSLFTSLADHGSQNLVILSADGCTIGAAPCTQEQALNAGLALEAYGTDLGRFDQNGQTLTLARSAECIGTIAGSCTDGGCVLTVLGNCNGGHCIGTVLGDCNGGSCIGTVGDCNGGHCIGTVGTCSGGCWVTIGFCASGGYCIGTIAGSCYNGGCVLTVLGNCGQPHKQYNGVYFHEADGSADNDVRLTHAYDAQAFTVVSWSAL